MSDPSQPDLFATGPAAPLDVHPGAQEFEDLARKLPGGLRFGTSSWTFPGWAGVVYDREATPSLLASHGLGAYARHPLLRCVAVDRTYYGPLEAATFRRFHDATPTDFRFVVKLDRRLVFTGGPGSDPDVFLNPAWAREYGVEPALTGLGDKLGALLLQFPPLDPGAMGGPRAFAERLYRFLDPLPREAPVVVEIRTPALLTEDYAQALRFGGGRHGYVVHPEMSDLHTQAATIQPRVDGHNLIRWMLQPGHRYAQARDAWAPFNELQRPDAVRRTEVAELAHRAAQAGGQVLVIINNKAEGSAPRSVEALANAFRSLEMQRSESS